VAGTPAHAGGNLPTVAATRSPSVLALGAGRDVVRGDRLDARHHGSDRALAGVSRQAFADANVSFPAGSEQIMKCQTARHWLLVSRADEALPKALRRHLTGCVRCRRRFRRLACLEAKVKSE